MGEARGEAVVSQGGFGSGTAQPCEGKDTTMVPMAFGECWLLPEDHQGPWQCGQGTVLGTPTCCLGSSEGVLETEALCAAAAPVPACLHCPGIAQCLLTMGRQQRLVPMGHLSWPLQKPGWAVWLFHSAKAQLLWDTNTPVSGSPLSPLLSPRDSLSSSPR